MILDIPLEKLDIEQLTTLKYICATIQSYEKACIIRDYIEHIKKVENLTKK